MLTYLVAAVTAAHAAASVHVAFALGFTIVVSLWLFDAAAILVSVLTSARTWILMVTLGLSAVIATAIAGTRDSPGDAVSASEAAPIAPGVHLPRVRLDGQRLFNELGCMDCHATGIGPELANRLGRPVADAGCGALTVDEGYIRESILNPTAVIAAGFSPVMPSFAGRLNESELAALVAYVASLSTPINVSH